MCASAYTTSVISTGAGTPSGRAVANSRNVSSKPEIGRPSAHIRASPRATLIMPRVAMNGGRRPIVTIAPFTSPQSAALVSASVTASGNPAPDCKALARTTPERASTEPTERSMPPDMIANVIPAATIALIALCSRTFSRFETVRKCGVSTQSTKPSATSPRSVPNWRALVTPGDVVVTRQPRRPRA